MSAPSRYIEALGEELTATLVDRINRASAHLVAAMAACPVEEHRDRLNELAKASTELGLEIALEASPSEGTA